ncbi:MAG: aminopeptidase [Oscillospiraceae bacterium]|nr:aminopeptidase [Oscillospiraceae bacterium]
MAETEKTAGQLLAEQLLIQNENGAAKLTEEEEAAADRFCEPYKEFLNTSKTEREAVSTAVAMLEKHGYEPFDPSKKYVVGDKLYYNNRGKALIFATMGSRPLEEGVNLMAAHIDSPRLDLKPNPLYEDTGLGYLKTHYYGGIRKYQWSALPLALHGVVAKKDGTVITVNLGDDANDPVFCVTDLLPHLSRDQDKRTLSDGIRGEELNILIGSRPFRDDKAGEKVKLALAKILFDKYGITEQDFLSAELNAVPAFPARDLGLDRSMIGSYGHDDKVCAYTALMAALEVERPAVTHVTILADKEETGSKGNTGMDSRFLDYFIDDLARPYGVAGHTVLSHSKCLSADVNCAHDPSFPDVTERRNVAYLGGGAVITKYTGAGGKNSTNDASAEFMAYVRQVLDGENVLWQTGELGKVGQGGGGTVAMYLSGLDIEVVDIGVPVLSMHSPFEVVSKADVWSTYRAFCAFIK